VHHRGAALPLLHLVGDHLALRLDLAVPPAHEALDRGDGVLRVEDRLPPGHLADQALPGLRERHHRRREPAPLRVGDHRRPPDHRRDHRVRGAQIADNLRRIAFLPAAPRADPKATYAWTVPGLTRSGLGIPAPRIPRVSVAVAGSSSVRADIPSGVRRGWQRDPAPGGQPGLLPKPVPAGDAGGVAHATTSFPASNTSTGRSRTLAARAPWTQRGAACGPPGRAQPGGAAATGAPGQGVYSVRALSSPALAGRGPRRGTRGCRQRRWLRRARE
jgi:hypothetical protein